MNKKTLLFSTLFIVFTAVSCRKNPVVNTISGSANDSATYNSDWTFATHGNSTPNYTTVFPQNSVNTIYITMTSAQWNSIKSNMKSLYGNDFGVGGGGAPGGTFPSTEPDYVDVLLKCNGKYWKNVGFRLKGNSSLSQAWSMGVYKLPFRLNFDKFEDNYPPITNQHFYGFEELSFSPSFKDQSLLREKITPDIFRMAGIPAAQTAFYTVYIDFGAGSKYCGVYTAVELPDDNMIKQQFGEESGNMYKPESQFSSFVQSAFEKKNNETAANYSDVQAFVTALNSNLRTTNATQWRANLEATFNVDHFIKYLAVNNAIVNWDTYGVMAHNQYLYNHSTNKLTWIPWDHNEALSGSPGIVGGVSGGMNRTGLSLSMNEVTSSWPLIRYIADDPVYMTKYKTYLKSFKDNVFTVAAMNALFDQYYNLISPFAIGANGEISGYSYLTSSASFTSALAALKTHVVDRRALITSYVP